MMPLYHYKAHLLPITIRYLHKRYDINKQLPYIYNICRSALMWHLNLFDIDKELSKLVI